LESTLIDVLILEDLGRGTEIFARTNEIRTEIDKRKCTRGVLPESRK
jgi:hypothetical protein